MNIDSCVAIVQKISLSRILQIKIINFHFNNYETKVINWHNKK